MCKAVGLLCLHFFFTMFAQMPSVETPKANIFILQNKQLTLLLVYLSLVLVVSLGCNLYP